MFKWLIVIINFILCVNLSAQSDPILRPGSMRFYFMPELHLIANTPVAGWDVITTKQGEKKFVKNAESTRAYKLSNGEYFFLDWWFMPLKGLKLNLGYEVAMDYADTYYQPINMEHTIDKEYHKVKAESNEDGLNFDQIKERIRFWRGKAEYKAKYLYSRVHKGYGHAGWEYEGDMFGFYTDQWDIANFRRIGSESAPCVFETDWSMYFNNVSYGKLSVALGPEPIWGNGWSYYAKYTYKYKLWVPTILYKNEGIFWGEEDERRWAAAFTTKYFGFRHLPLEGGILFQPFRTGREYFITKETSQIEGLGASGYSVTSRKTDVLDALGFKVKGSSTLVPFMDKTILTVSHLGKSAGNVDRFDLELEKKIYSYYTFYLQNIVQFPVEGPQIWILEGTAENPGQPVVSSRDRNGAFWVDRNNREGFISSFIFIYDPTPGSWPFIYRPYILELWNLNKNETSPFTFMINYKMTYYSGTTDLEPYKNSKNEWLWPGEYDSTAARMPAKALGGCWPLRRPIHFLTMIGEFKVFNNGLAILMINTGEGLATSSLAYTKSTYELIPITRMFQASINVYKYPYFGSFEFGHNVWGPEYWYQELGAVVDRVYKLKLGYNLDKNNEFQFEYTGFREIDNRYFLAKLGPFDEFRLCYKGRFGARVSLYD